jgi:hypothetical protein
MSKCSLKACHPVSGESAQRVTLSIAAEDKAALSKIADEKKAGRAWIIRDVITGCLSKKSRA